MVRKANAKRKGISKDLPRGLVLSKRQNYDYSWVASTIKKFLSLQKLTQSTEYLFNKYLRIVVTLNLVPLEKKENGQYDAPTGLAIMPFWLSKVLTLIIIVHRLVVSLTLAKHEEITPPILLGITYSVALACVWIMSEWNPAETAFVSRNTVCLLNDLSREENRKYNLFDSTLLCVKVICAILLVPACAASFAVANGLLYMGLPTCWFQVAQGYGVITVGSEDVIWWLLIFLPLEFATVLGPLLTAAYLAIMAFSGQQAFETYGKNIRRIDVVDLESRLRVEQMYTRWEIYMRASNDWTKVMTAPLILGVSGNITMALFVTIRFTEIPYFLYILFPLLAFTLLFLMGNTLHECVTVNEISQQVLSGQLLSFQNSHELRLLPKDKRKLVALRAKAFKPIAFPIGPFTDIKYEVMANIWEEILNQLLFFLSF